MLGNFLKLIRDFGVNQKRLKRKKHSIKQFFSFYQATDVNDVTESDIINWMHYLTNSGIQPSTIDKKISDIKSYFNILIREDILYKNPCARIKLRNRHNPQYPRIVNEQNLLKLHLMRILNWWLSLLKIPRY